MSEHLYPTLVADSSLSTPAANNCSILQKQITSKLDKYLQEAAEKHERYDNYYDGWHMATNTSSPQQEANLLDEDDDTGSDEEDNNEIVPESHGQDTGAHPTPGRVREHPRGRITTNRRKTGPSRPRYYSVHHR